MHEVIVDTVNMTEVDDFQGELRCILDCLASHGVDIRQPLLFTGIQGGRKRIQAILEHGHREKKETTYGHTLEELQHWDSYAFGDEEHAIRHAFGHDKPALVVYDGKLIKKTEASGFPTEKYTPIDGKTLRDALLAILSIEQTM